MKKKKTMAIRRVRTEFKTTVCPSAEENGTIRITSGERATSSYPVEDRIGRRTKIGWQTIKKKQKNSFLPHSISRTENYLSGRGVDLPLYISSRRRRVQYGLKYPIFDIK